jgi:hypothetical protein
MTLDRYSKKNIRQHYESIKNESIENESIENRSMNKRKNYNEYEIENNNRKIFINGISNSIIQDGYHGLIKFIEKQFGNIQMVMPRTKHYLSESSQYIVIIFEKDSSIKSILNHKDSVIEISNLHKKAKLRMYIPCYSRYVYINVSHDAYINTENDMNDAIVEHTTPVQKQHKVQFGFNETQLHQINNILCGRVNCNRKKQKLNS